MRAIAVIVLLALVGCASLQVGQNPNATPEQILAAKNLDCETARAVVKQADTEMAAPGVSVAAKKYWGEYSLIARLTVTMFCGPTPPPEVKP